MTSEPALNSLEDLVGVWPSLGPDASKLMRMVHRARQTPLDQLDVEGLRILVAQNVDIDSVIPVALDKLQIDPLAEGDYYAGDLLEAVLEVAPSYWDSHQDQRSRVVSIIDRVRGLRTESDDVDEELVELMDEFSA